MRASQFFIATQKEAPSDAELISHQLMVRAGLIKKLGSGLYSWMPLGLRVLRKVEHIVRDEMNKAGALELLMPAVQPKELWEETGRWAVFGPQMLKIQDRHARDFCFGPTHEEVITDIARKEINSYKQLPLNFYQIQTKFRDEIRPRFGVMRAREFLMKDAYSFHTSADCLVNTYQAMHTAYSNIFTRLGLKFRAVKADSGAIGGDGSQEFHVLADSGEDALAYCEQSDYAANVELAEAVASGQRAAASEAMREVDTPKQTACEAVAGLLELPVSRTVKSVALMVDEVFTLALLRGDHQLNEVKFGKLAGVTTFRLATEEEIRAHLNCPPGFIGPVGVSDKVRVIADRTVALMSDFVCGANKPKFHLAGVNFGRDLPEPVVVADIRNVVAGDMSPDGKGQLSLCRGIEVGHIFQLRTKYSEAMQATYLDENGQTQVMEMGCYGIGVSRIVGAAIEQGNDDKGIVFPLSMAPFAVVICPIGLDKSDAVKQAAFTLYTALQQAGVDVLLDDRGERPGVMFAESDLMGIPHRIVIGDRGLAQGEVEYKGRTDAEAQNLQVTECVAFLRDKLGQ
ncbi:proline--tRNA ligase [Methylophilus medardicus]|uniref:Proline--tRNA ligase n=1 Tax=Methylophilus medardicus TaxID=2588534 RepID=A0A5B8CU92_9PROT|nr:proline--tRNA ligase [Methylophilus medardicus]QDC44823.1 proline--tRNA ligase [Methylophilus medardicus]QDC49830.1 proline--tRNA ligase [Methylophilus medardicus]QDC53535.1 proline--tRNA ligase [Methylophilus medardicus]